jgi:hypothetical protein
MYEVNDGESFKIPLEGGVFSTSHIGGPPHQIGVNKRRQSRRESKFLNQLQVEAEHDEESDVMVSITTYSYFSNYLLLTLSILFISLSTLFSLYTDWFYNYS